LTFEKNKAHETIFIRHAEMPMYLGWRHFTRNAGVCPRCENSFLLQSSGVSPVKLNKCTCVFPWQMLRQ